MRRTLTSLSLVVALLCLGAASPAGADPARAGAVAAGPAADAPAGPAAGFDRTLHPGSGAAFDELLRRSGVEETEIAELRRAQRAAAIRAAYERGDLRAIGEIEAALPAGEIAAARAETGVGSQNQVPSYVWYSCGAGSGVTAQFRVFGSWWAYFETTTGSRTSTQEGHCGDWWNGCLITDSISGSPNITWRFHKMNAFEYGYHAGWCS